MPTALKLQMVLDKSATDDQLLDALRDEMGRLKAQLQQAHQVQAQLQAAAASGMR
jgi:TRAP-type mannitol/chloroaromatic compound transport system permease large subunit